MPKFTLQRYENETLIPILIRAFHILLCFLLNILIYPAQVLKIKRLCCFFILNTLEFITKIITQALFSAWITANFCAFTRQVSRLWPQLAVVLLLLSSALAWHPTKAWAKISHHEFNRNLYNTRFFSKLDNSYAQEKSENSGKNDNIALNIQPSTRKNFNLVLIAPYNMPAMEKFLDALNSSLNDDLPLGTTLNINIFRNLEDNNSIQEIVKNIRRLKAELILCVGSKSTLEIGQKINDIPILGIGIEKNHPAYQGLISMANLYQLYFEIPDSIVGQTIYELDYNRITLIGDNSGDYARKSIGIYQSLLNNYNNTQTSASSTPIEGTFIVQSSEKPQILTSIWRDIAAPKNNFIWAQNTLATVENIPLTSDLAILFEMPDLDALVAQLRKRRSNMVLFGVTPAAILVGSDLAVGKEMGIMVAEAATASKSMLGIAVKTTPYGETIRLYHLDEIILIPSAIDSDRSYSLFFNENSKLDIIKFKKIAEKLNFGFEISRDSYHNQD